jgi:hypothetical protein
VFEVREAGAKATCAFLRNFTKHKLPSKQEEETPIGPPVGPECLRQFREQSFLLKRSRKFSDR